MGKGKLSKLRMPGRARERDHVADIHHTGDITDRPLEAEPETRVRHRAIAAEVAVPVVLFLGQAHFIEAGVQDVEPLLALGAADQSRRCRGPKRPWPPRSCRRH